MPIRAAVCRVHEVDHPGPRRLLLGGVDPGAAGGDPAGRADADHLGHHQRRRRRAPCRPGAPGGTRRASRPAPSTCPWPRPRPGCAAPARPAGTAGTSAAPAPAAPANQRSVRATNPGSRSRRLSWVTRRLRVTMLNANWVGMLVHVVPDVLEPLPAGLRRPLGGLHDRPPLRLVAGQRPLRVGLLVQAGGQRQRVLHGQFGARADGEVRGVRGVAEQHHVAVAPGPRAHRGEGRPARVVAVQHGPVEQVGEQLADRRDRLRSFSPGPRSVAAIGPNARVPDVLVHLHDHRAGVRAVGVAVQLDHAVRGLPHVEREGVEHQVGAQPHVAAAAGAAPLPRMRHRPGRARRSSPRRAAITRSCSRRSSRSAGANVR